MEGIGFLPQKEKGSRSWGWGEKVEAPQILVCHVMLAHGDGKHEPGEESQQQTFCAAGC